MFLLEPGLLQCSLILTTQKSLFRTQSELILFDFFILLLFFLLLKSLALAYSMSHSLTVYDPMQPLRSSSTNLLVVPECITKTSGEGAFSV